MRQAAAEAAGEGWRLSFGPPRRSGWPTAAELVLPAVAVEGSELVFPPGLTWTAARVRVRLGISQPTSVLISAEGEQTVGTSGVPRIPFRARGFVVTAALAGANPATASIAELEARLPAGSLRIAAALLAFPPDGLVADIHDLSVPNGAGGELGPPIEQVHVRAEATQPFPRGPTPAASARAWRAAGGRIDLRKVALRWGPLTATGRVSIALDEELQPGADGVIEATGLVGLIDQLAGSGVLPPGAATAGKAVVAILAAPAGAGPIRLPVQLRAGVLSVAGFPLLRLPPLVWE